MKFGLLSSASLVALGSAMSLLAPGAAYAGLVCGSSSCTETVGLGSTQTDIGTFSSGIPTSGSPVTLNDFNSAMGNLKSVVISENGTYLSTGTLKNSGTLGTQSFTFSLTMNLGLFASATSPANFPTITQGKSSNSQSFTLIQGQSADFRGAPSSSFSKGATITSGLAAYEGTGTFTVDFATLTGETFTGGGGQIGASLQTVVTPSVTITYNFTTAVPAPEPASLALLGAGLAGVGVTRRRRKA